ncbi:MAG: TVP38/TMEM64 family protein [Myxococcales bacterium]|nr:TVP38/TMEM64 family protein [Myxococcales bacterium]
MTVMEGKTTGGLLAAPHAAPRSGGSLSDKVLKVASDAVQNVSKGKATSSADDSDAPAAEPASEEVSPSAERKAERRATVRNLVIRLTALVAVLTGVYFAAKFFGVIEYIHSGEMQHYMVDAGWTGVIVFCLVYCVGVVAHVPGLVFVFAAVLAYGPVGGGTVSLLGGIPAVAITFLVVRAVGGTALAHVKNPYMRRVLSHLDERPIQSVFLLRLVFIMAPGVNYGLALSKVRFRDYVIGSALGLIIPIAVSSWIIDYIWN